MINKTFIIIISICLIQLFSGNSFTVEPEEVLENQKQELRARNISKNIRCMICQNQSIDESNAPLAKDLRIICLLYTSPSPRDRQKSRMPSSA